MIKIDEGKCSGCLRCVQACPFAIIEECGGKPFVHEDKPGCIRCMHCGIVCPESAVTYNGKPMMISEEKPAASDSFREDLEGFLMTRRSYRNFRPEPVDESLLRCALETAAWAPSAKNQHAVRYVVVQGREKIEQMMDIILAHLKKTGDNPEVISAYDAGKNMVFGNAPTLILAYCRSNAVNPAVDTALALDYTELMLQAGGVGTCWAGYATRFLNQIPELKEMFRLPEGSAFYGSLLAGYPLDDYLYIPERVKRADIDFR